MPAFSLGLIKRFEIGNGQFSLAVASKINNNAFNFLIVRLSLQLFVSDRFNHSIQIPAVDQVTNEFELNA
jgi:hypothetical protein